MTKRCPKCGEKKEGGEFNRSTKDKLQSYCRVCAKAYSKSRDQARFAASPDLVKTGIQNILKWRATNKERTRQGQAKRSRAWYVANRIRHKDLARQWREKNAEHVIAKARAHYNANGEQYRRNRKLWRLNNPARRQAHDQKRRACRNGAPATLTGGEWKILKDEFGQRCAYCGGRPAKLSQDHVVSLKCGGGHIYENIAPACGACNSRKGTKTLEQFMEMR